MFMKQMADASISSSKVIKLDDDSNDKSSKLPAGIREKVVIKKVDGPLFFGNVKEIRSLASTIPASIEYVMIDLTNVPHMDKSGLNTLEDIVLDLESKDIHILFIGLNEQTTYMLESIDIMPDLVEVEHVFKTFEDGAKWLEDHLSA